MILEIYGITISIALIFFIYIFVHALRRINTYENFIIQFQQIVEYSTEKMKQVDQSGHYEADDETGFFFKQLKELQLLLNGIFEEKNNI